MNKSNLLLKHKERIEKIANIFKALGNPARLCLLEKLVIEGEKSVSDISECMELSQPAISQHLAKLKSLGLVESRKEDSYVLYSCKRKDMHSLVSLMDKIEGE